MSIRVSEKNNKISHSFNEKTYFEAELNVQFF